MNDSKIWDKVTQEKAIAKKVIAELNVLTSISKDILGFFSIRILKYLLHNLTYTKGCVITEMAQGLWVKGFEVKVKQDIKSGRNIGKKGVLLKKDKVYSLLSIKYSHVLPMYSFEVRNEQGFSTTLSIDFFTLIDNKKVMLKKAKKETTGFLF